MNNQIFAENIASLGIQNKEQADSLKEISSELIYEVISAKSGDYTLKLEKDGKPVLVHSKYNPKEEAHRLFKNKEDSNPELIIIGGFGLGYTPEAATEIFPDVPVIVWEKDDEIFKIAINTRNLSNLLSNKNVKIIIEKDISLLTEVLKQYKTRKIFISIHRPYMLLDKDFYSEMVSVIRSYIDAKDVNINTLAVFEKLWSKNILANMDFFIKNTGVKSLFDKFADIPAVIVAAGPSLNKQLGLLKENQSRLLIIACDTVYQVLYRKGIRPDFVLAVDPQEINQKYFINVEPDYGTLVCEPAVSQGIIRQHPEKYYITGSAFPLINWLENFTGEMGRLNIGGSVATACYSFAVKLGCDPIIFIGLDLAYSNGDTHTKGAYYEQRWIYEQDRFLTTLTRQKLLFNRIFTTKIKGYYEDEEVVSDTKFTIFLDWFESNFKICDKTIIDATEGGAYKKNCIQMSFNDAIQKYASNDIIKNIPEINNRHPEYETNKKQIYSQLREGLDLLEEVLPHAKKAVELSHEFYRLIKRKVHSGRNEKKLPEIIKSLDDIDKIIAKKKETNQFLSLSMQRIINIIKEEMEVDLTDEEKKHKELKIARQSIMLYEEIVGSINFMSLHIKKTLIRFSGGKN